jgi:Uma2 family endonuclease
VPDVGVHRSLPNVAVASTAALVIEVVSPGDESWDKFDHYAAHDVDEVLIADPARRTLDLFILTEGRYERAAQSRLLGVSTHDLHDLIAWPEPI